MTSGSENALTTDGTGSEDNELHSHSKTAQEKQILEYLKAGNTLTPLEALHLFGSFRLSARVHQLRKQHHISTVMITIRPGTRVARYHYVKSAGKPHE